MLRDFDAADPVVRQNYALKHRNATLSQTRRLIQKWLPPKHTTMTVEAVLEALKSVTDESDPDVCGANYRHAFETAEALRREHPDDEAMHVVGILHDLGKVMAFYGEEQHFVVGDTYPIGCEVSRSVPLAECARPTETSIYAPGCGLDNLIMTWGHDEYLYRVLRASGCSLPDVYMGIIRFHSFYAWHTARDYVEYESAYDRDVLLPAIKKFNRCDLYSKLPGHELDDETCEHLWRSYYKPLLTRYGLGGHIVW